MVDIQSENSSKKCKRSLYIREESKDADEFKQKTPKKVKFSDETAVKSVESTAKGVKSKRKPKFSITANSQAPDENNEERESKLAKRKSLNFGEELVLEDGRTVVIKPNSRTSILKGSIEAVSVAVAEGDEQAASKVKKKLSKNAIKRIKWVKRHRKKTVSKRKRKANLMLARERPQRDIQERVAKAIEYLNAWYETPETWKYQKIAQTTLIKYAFNSQLINGDTYELLLHYLAGVQGSACDRIRSMCHQVIDNEGAQPESPALPLSIPESEDSAGVIERANQMLEFVLPSTLQL